MTLSKARRKEKRKEFLLIAAWWTLLAVIGLLSPVLIPLTGAIVLLALAGALIWGNLV